MAHISITARFTSDVDMRYDYRRILKYVIASSRGVSRIKRKGGLSHKGSGLFVRRVRGNFLGGPFGAADIHCFRQFIDWFNQKEYDFALLFCLHSVYDNTRDRISRS